MSQQSHCWAYTPRKPELKETHIPQCSLQHCLQQLTRTWKQPRYPSADGGIRKSWYIHTMTYSVQFSSVTQSCLTLCDPMNRSTPGLPVHHQLPESTQTHVHRVGDAIILCRPLLPLPLIPPSIRVFSSESTLPMRWPKYWSFSFSISPSNEHPGLISFRMDWLDILALLRYKKNIFETVLMR